MPIVVKYKDYEFKISINHEELIREVEEDILEFGKDFEVYAICKKISVNVPFSDDYAQTDCIVDYQFVPEDLNDLSNDEYALKTTLGKLLTRLVQEDSVL